MNALAEVPSERCIIDIAIEEDELRFEQRQRKWQMSREFLAPLVNTLEPLSVTITYDGVDLNICGSGDKSLLLTYLRAIRALGYVTEDNPPKPGVNQWVARFRSPRCPLSIWLNFTSTVCRRVQVGTVERVVKEPVYETICGDLTTEIEENHQPEAG